MKPLSIIVFSRDLDIYSLSMLQALEKRGHQIRVIIEPQNHAHAKNWSSGITLLDKVKLNGRFDKVAAKHYAQAVQQYQADVCLCYTSRALSVALTAKRLYQFKAPIVGSRGAIGGVSAFYVQDWFTYLSPRLSAVACMSQAIANKLTKESKRFYPNHPGVFEVIYPAYGRLMDTHEAPKARQRSLGDTVNLLCIANDRPIKGLLLLLEAVEQHLTTMNWRLDLVGECGEAVKKKIQSSNKLSTHVHAHGYRKDVPDFLRQAHIYIQPTLAPGEGIGNSMAEAMSFGLLVITSNMGGGIELIQHEESGLHFEVGNAVALASTIDRLVQDPVACDRLGARAAQTLEERFSLEAEAQQFEQLFQRVMA
jgi:glycosyltransferase involved in cell wall biosynthesis